MFEGRRPSAGAPGPRSLRPRSAQGFRKAVRGLEFWTKRLRGGVEGVYRARV